MKVTVFMIIVGIIFLCIFVGLLTLIVRALLKYIHSKDVRQEKSVVRKSLGEALKVHRTQCKMTQEFVAETIGVSRQAVSKWENGTSDPSTYLYTSLAPIPFATMSNREWGHVGTNYFRGLFALAFQAFLMMVCVAIYAALIGSIRVSSDIHSALFGTMAYTVILCFSLLKTGSLSKQIFGSH